MIHHGNLDTVILMLRRTPADTCFQPIFTKHWHVEDMCFDVFEEADIVFTRSYFELFSDVLKEVDMTNLYHDVVEDVLCRLFDRRIVITRE